MSEKITLITIGGHHIGLAGTSEIFEQFKQKHLSEELELKNQLLEHVRIHNYVPDSLADAYASAILREYQKFAGLPLAPVDEKSAFPVIRILGPGCAACDTLEKNVRAILSELNIAADVDHIRDINQIAEFGMVRTPALVINNSVVLSGQSLPRVKIKKLIEKNLA